MDTVTEKQEPIDVEIGPGFVKAIPERDITIETARNYGVITTGSEWVFPYPTGAKIRTQKEKKFWSKNPITGLFGQDKFAAGGRYVTITEGELDAMSVYQMFGNKFAAVSVRSASSALSDCQAAFEWLNSFDQVVIAFDSDEPGQQAATKVAELFSHKAKIVKLSRHKDANAYLMAQDSKAFVDSWWAAEKYNPEGIINAADLIDELLEPKPKALFQYPFNGLNKLTYGVRAQELVTVTAGSGIGKSQFLRELVWQVIKTTELSVGVFFLEESRKKTAEAFVSMAANQPLHLPSVEYTHDEYRQWAAEGVGHRRIEIFDSFAYSDIDGLIAKIRHMVKALGCRVIVLDHVSIIVSSQAFGDERKAIDEVMTKLRQLVQETGCVLFAVSHLKRPEGKGHEEGAAVSLAQLRGSGSIAQLSDIVIGLQRDGQADDPRERNTTYARVLKNRFCGMTGPAGAILYNPDTGRMNEIEEESL